MAIGTGIVLAIIGAIIRYGITGAVEGLDLAVIGNILMIGGAAWALVAVGMSLFGSHEDHSTDAHRHGDATGRTRRSTTRAGHSTTHGSREQTA